MESSVYLHISCSPYSLYVWAILLLYVYIQSYCSCTYVRMYTRRCCRCIHILPIQHVPGKSAICESYCLYLFDVLYIHCPQHLTFIRAYSMYMLYTKCLSYLCFVRFTDDVRVLCCLVCWCGLSCRNSSSC